MISLTDEQALTIVIDAISKVAPDVATEVASLDQGVDLWEELLLDSMDHLSVMTNLAERTGLEIAERDYAQLRSLHALAKHLSILSR